MQEMVDVTVNTPHLLTRKKICVLRKTIFDEIFVKNNFMLLLDAREYCRSSVLAARTEHWAS